MLLCDTVLDKHICLLFFQSICLWHILRVFLFKKESSFSTYVNYLPSPFDL